MKWVMKVLASIFLVAALVVAATSVTPIYSFRAPEPFSGEDVFNPYASLDTAIGWKRSLFHCHTKVSGPLNECEYTAGETLEALEKFGYGIVTFSNHNRITPYPTDSTLQVNVYEHGYSPFKFHKLVFGSGKVCHYDHLLPLLASQKQFQLDYLGAGSDFIQMNHPYRTIGTSKKHMEELSGYEIMELDSGISTQNEYWDWALSAGHYSFGLANDDLHHPDWSSRIAVRCNFLNCPSARYEDIKNTLLGGCFYSMRVPNYGNGDWEVKYERNRHLPFVRNIGLRGNTVFMELSQKADSIRVNGQDHETLALALQTDSISYALGADEPYCRLTAFFPDGEVIYTNPFARYDSSSRESPFDNSPQKVNILLTVLYNLMLLAVIVALVFVIARLWRKK
ncbi:MAG: hypothetical protein J5835_01380 [Bacteroidales bacterium]|nr:hypothetical protein [Bacteroidales bacterium]